MRVCQMGIEVSMSSKTLMTQFANSLHVLVEGVLGHLLHELEGHLVGHAVVQGDVIPVLFDHFAPNPRAFIRPGFGDHGQQLILEMDFAQVLQVLGHAFIFDGADLAIKIVAI